MHTRHITYQFTERPVALARRVPRQSLDDDGSHLSLGGGGSTGLRALALSTTNITSWVSLLCNKPALPVHS